MFSWKEVRNCTKANKKLLYLFLSMYEGWNFNSGNYLFTTDTK